MVELGRTAGSDYGTGAVADEAGHTAALERHRTSADTRQGGALSRRARTCAHPARTEWAVAPALAGRLSLGAQLPASARGPGHADPSQSLVFQPTALRSQPAALALPGGRLGAEGRLPGQAGHRRYQVAHRSRSGRGVGPGPQDRTTPAGLLLQHPDPGTRTGHPRLDHRGAMDSDPRHGGRKRRRRSRLGKRCAFPTFPPSRRLLKLERISRNILERLSWNLTRCWLEWASTKQKREGLGRNRSRAFCLY